MQVFLFIAAATSGPEEPQTFVFPSPFILKLLLFNIILKGEKEEKRKGISNWYFSATGKN